MLRTAQKTEEDAEENDLMEEATDAAGSVRVGHGDPRRPRPRGGDARSEEAPVLPPQEVRAVLEALIFASPQPITPREIAQVLQGRAEGGLAGGRSRSCSADYARDGRGLQLVEVAGGYQITTRPEYNDWVRELLDPQARRRGCRSRRSRRWP